MAPTCDSKETAKGKEKETKCLGIQSEEVRHWLAKHLRPPFRSLYTLVALSGYASQDRLISAVPLTFLIEARGGKGLCLEGKGEGGKGGGGGGAAVV
ncbi:hypothetical protein E2C01_010000 [Portunus trituberculatus]|uniref:Uncharacterized protein n=1 Tax=Portunus trituberculatus TaxID=210409 RepID=A0A5B7D7H9_PORTR|nr:hypothetical protein [Portunus trituberculatus]